MAVAPRTRRGRSRSSQGGVNGPGACQHRSVPEPLADALASLRPLLLDADALVKAVAAGRRRGAGPVPARAELRPVDLAAGRRLQLVTTGEQGPVTRNVDPGDPAEATVDALLAEPFGSWHVETRDRVVQLRVTKRGEAQVHTEAGAGRHVAGHRALLTGRDELEAAAGRDLHRPQLGPGVRRELAPAPARGDGLDQRVGVQQQRAQRREGGGQRFGHGPMLTGAGVVLDHPWPTVTLRIDFVA